MDVRTVETRKRQQDEAVLNVRLQQHYDQGFEHGTMAASHWPDFVAGLVLGVLGAITAPYAWHAVAAFLKVA